MKTKHGVDLAYGKTKIRLSSEDLQLIADALDIAAPDNSEVGSQAIKLANSFHALAAYAKSV